MNEYGYGYGPHVGALPSKLTPMTRVLVEAFVKDRSGRPPATWRELTDWLLAAAIEISGEQEGIDDAQMAERLRQAAGRYGIRL